MIFPIFVLSPPAFDFVVEGGQGLTVKMSGVPVLRGSSFQYYAPGWTKGYYSSSYNSQQFTFPDPDTVNQSFVSPDRKATGTITYRRDGTRLKVHVHFEWNSDEEAQIEVAAGMVWLPAVQAGTLNVDGKPSRPLQESPTGTSRTIADAGNRYRFLAPFGSIGLDTATPMAGIDGRNYSQDWASKEPLLWIGTGNPVVARGKPVDIDYTWQFEPATGPGSALTRTVRTTATAVPNAVVADTSQPVLIPQPRYARLKWDRPLRLTGSYAFPAGRFRYFEDFQRALKRRFVVTPAPKGAKSIDVDGGVSKLGFPPGGYKIAISENSISVLGEEEIGLKIGLRRLAQLAFVKDGALCLPTGDILDQPTTRWRGVHLFGGPEALSFQTRLWDRVLTPMGFNKVVVQCERTDWDATKRTSTSITISKDGLKSLFDFYRSQLVEPIPLIQSLGHMEWLFANRENLELALNPDVPYQIDPRKPAAQAKISEIWDEAIALLKPETIHFGLDEIDMRGMPTDDPALTTELWVKQLPFLGRIAADHQVKMMLWGDQALAPGEAADAALGDSAADARVRRAAIPKGAMIADWHYKDDPNYRAFLPSLRLWKEAGLTPVASSWYKPNNIRGFSVAATMEGSGTLQTTWCGYASNEQGLQANPEQFSAMILAADYAWSGRQDPPEKIGYDPTEVLQRMYFGQPSPIRPVAGQCLVLEGQAGKQTFLAGTQFNLGTPLVLDTVLGSTRTAQSLRVDPKITAQNVAFALDTLVPLRPAEVAGEITITLVDGRVIHRPVRYGSDVRAIDDARTTVTVPRQNGLSVLTVALGTKPAKVKTIEISNAGSYAGLRIHGITAW